MIPHKLTGRNKEPKLQYTKEPTPTYADNYVPISHDYEKHCIGPKSGAREYCHVTEAERNHMLQSSAVRIKRDAPELLTILD